MNLTALILVVTAAFAHALWNFLAKKSSAGSLFVWCYTLFSVLVYAPFAIILILQGHLPSTHIAWIAIAASSFLHLGYSTILQRGYQVADLTVVYPIARGTGPLLASLGAYLLLGETVTPLSITGLLVIVTGIGIIAKLDQVFSQHHTSLRNGIKYGSIIGLFIATYTLVDSYSIKIAGTHPVLLDVFTNLARCIILAPNAYRNKESTYRLLKEKWHYALGVGILCPLAYILVLTAIKFSPVSLIAPAREMSMMIAALLGTLWLKEGDSKRRLIGAAFIVTGTFCLTLSK